MEVSLITGDCSNVGITYTAIDNKFEEIICELVFPVKNRKIQGPTKKDIGLIQGSSF
jgi:hypothetical protein